MYRCLSTATTIIIKLAILMNFDCTKKCLLLVLHVCIPYFFQLQHHIMVEPVAKSNFFFLFYLWTILIVKLFFCGAKIIRMYIYAVGNSEESTSPAEAIFKFSLLGSVSSEFVLLTKARPKLRTSKGQFLICSKCGPFPNLNIFFWCCNWKKYSMHRRNYFPLVNTAPPLACLWEELYFQEIIEGEGDWVTKCMLRSC